MGLVLPATAIEQLANYLELLVKWNQVYNLTAIKDEASFKTEWPKIGANCGTNLRLEDFVKIAQAYRSH